MLRAFFVRVSGFAAWLPGQPEELFGVSGCLAREEEKEQLFRTQRQGVRRALAAWEEDTNNCSKCPQGGVPGAASQAVLFYARSSPSSAAPNNCS